jgi:hypothetical protein
VALVIAALVVASFVASEIGTFREAPALQPVASVSDPADGCQRFLALFSGLLRDKPDDAEAERRFEQLWDAARDNDPLLASDIQDILNGDGAADVSAGSQIIVRRCAAAGHITQDDVRRLGEAAMSAIGAATVAPKPHSAAQRAAQAAALQAAHAEALRRQREAAPDPDDIQGLFELGWSTGCRDIARTPRASGVLVSYEECMSLVERTDLDLPPHEAQAFGAYMAAVAVGERYGE